MLVKDYMTKHPPMGVATMSIVEAKQYMADNHVHHLSIVGSGKRLVGLLTRHTLLIDPGRLSSLDMWDIARYLANLTVEQVMIKAANVVTVPPDTPIETAAQVMVKEGVGCLPVIEDGIVVGIITETDLMRQLMEMMSTDVPAVRVTVRMPMQRGELSRLVAVIASHGWGIEALGGVVMPRDPSRWEAVIKIQAPPERVVAAISILSEQEIVDVREMGG